MRRITITEALCELKLYDSKIRKAISNSEFVSAKKKSSKLVGHKTVENFNDKAKADYQSVTDLIRNRNALKSAIVVSNAITELEVAGITMTRAEAIEKKDSIQYDRFLLNEMKTQYVKAKNKLDMENKKVDKQVEDAITTFLGKDSDKKITEEMLTFITNPIRNQYEFEMVDILNIEKKIEELEKYIDEFESDVDAKLTLSNSLTYIELEN